MMEMAVPNTMESIAQCVGGKFVSAHDIQQHKPIVQLNDNNNDATTDELCQASRNLDQEFDNDNGRIISPKDPPVSDITLLDFSSSSPPPTPAQPSVPIQPTHQAPITTSE